MDTSSLNAPSGAGCFLTINGKSFVLIKSFSLNAPCGAECFLTTTSMRSCLRSRVLMHLLVLGAF